MQDGERLGLAERGREEDRGAQGTEEGNLTQGWRRFAPGGKTGRLERELRRRQRAARRLRDRSRKRSRRRQNRELMQLERELLGRRPTVRLPSLRFSRKSADAATSELNTRIAKAIEGALEVQREQLRAEFRRTLDQRLSEQAAEMEQRLRESEERAIQHAEDSINKVVTEEMWRSVGRRLRRSSWRPSTRWSSTQQPGGKTREGD